MGIREWFKTKKAKAIAALGCFAMLLGVGASVSVVSTVKENEVVETKAAGLSSDTTIYFRDRGWWAKEGGCTNVHHWGSASGTSWPGASATCISDSGTRTNDGGNIWSFTLPQGTTNFMFARSNSGGDEDWGAKSTEIAVTSFSGDKLLFDLSDSEVWGNPGATTTAYRKPNYYLLGSGVGTSDSWDINKAVAADSDTVSGNKASWSGVKISNGANFKMVYYPSRTTDSTPQIDYTPSNNALSGRCTSNGFSGAGGDDISYTGTTYTDFKAFFTDSNTISFNRDFTITYYEVKNGSTSSGNTTTGNSDILLGTTLSGKFGTYTGYSITGYYSNLSPKTSVDIASVYPAAAMSVYAEYEAAQVTVTLNKQSGSGGTNSVTATYGAAMPSAVMPTRTGYTFGGYFTSTGGAGTKYYNADGSSAKNWDKTTNTVLYAKWTANTYTVSFDRQSGTGGSSSVTATFGSAMPSASMPTREHYSFGGYWDAKNGGGTQYYTSSGASARNWDKASDTTLYAKWTADVYTVTISAQFYQGSTKSGDAALANGSATYGVTYTPPTPAADTSYPIVYTYSGVNYTFQGWYSDLACTIAFVSKSDHTAGFTIYAKYTDQNTYSLTYYKVADGVLQVGDTVVSSIACGTTVASAGGTPTLYGYSFDGWYQESSCSNSYGSHEITGATTAYAKFTRLSTNTTYYADISTCKTYINGTIYVHFFKKSGDDLIASTTWPGIKVSAIAGTGNVENVYAFSIPADATGFIINNNDGSSRAQAQTVDITPSADHNLYSVTTNNASSNQEGEWCDIVYQLGGYFSATSYDSSGQGDWTYVKMHAPTDASGNQAEINGITCTAFTQIKVRLIIGQSEGDPKQMWYGHAGTGYAFLDYTSGRTNSSVSKTDDNDGYSNAFFKTAGTYSFYLKDGIIYIEDDANKDDAGYLYFANAASAEDITVTAINSDSVTIESAVRLSRITGVKSVSNLKFNGISGMHKISLYNLRGNDTSHYITSLTLSVGGASRTYTWAEATSDSPNIYIDISSSTQDSTTKGPAAAVAMDIALAIANATNTSVCNIDQDTAKELCDAYDVSAVKTLLESNTSNYYITTWNSTKPTYSGSRNAGFHDIRVQLGRIAGGNYVIASSFNVAPDAGSPLTLTLWIVLGAGVAGMVAIGAAYFVSKKKKKGDRAAS